jgi:serpin B
MQLYEATIPLASGKGWKATELEYRTPDGEPGLTMTLILPDDLGAFERSLTPAKVAAIDRDLATERGRLDRITPNPDRWGMDCGAIPYAVNLFLPRFGIDTRGNVLPALVAAGMRAPVSDVADFSGISDAGLTIGAVIHQANIDVDEKGTEAAAATAVVMDTTGGCGGPVPETVKTLRLNRPFMFLLRDTQTGAILFMGRVADPLVRG